MDKKVKPVLNGAAETMLQSFYARAQYSKKKNHKIYDEKAVEIVERIDYDFTSAGKDTTMSGGVIARTIVLDELVNKFIAEKWKNAFYHRGAFHVSYGRGKCENA